MQVFTAFLVSCVLLMAMSWIVAFYPSLSLKTFDPQRGIFVKNYIDQSQEFALCAVALAYPVIMLLRERRIRLALLLGAIALSLVVNMAFVIVSRTAMVTMPIMLAVFALLHLKWRTNVVIACAVMALAALAWAASPQLRWTTETFFRDYQLYKEKNIPTSIGLRLEYWQKSLRLFAEAPVIGHGTGSTRGLFEQAAAGQVGAAAEVVGNPHNQTLNIAVQWGAVGIVVLYAMWLLASAAVPRRRSGRLDRFADSRAEYFHLAVQFALVRFPRRLDVRFGGRCCRRDGAEERVERSDSGTGASAGS